MNEHLRGICKSPPLVLQFITLRTIGITKPINPMPHLISCMMRAPSKDGANGLVEPLREGCAFFSTPFANSETLIIPLFACPDSVASHGDNDGNQMDEDYAEIVEFDEQAVFTQEPPDLL